MTRIQRLMWFVCVYIKAPVVATVLYPTDIILLLRVGRSLHCTVKKLTYLYYKVTKVYIPTELWEANLSLTFSLPSSHAAHGISHSTGYYSRRLFEIAP